MFQITKKRLVRPLPPQESQAENVSFPNFTLRNTTLNPSLTRTPLPLPPSRYPIIFNHTLNQPDTRRASTAPLQGLKLVREIEKCEAKLSILNRQLSQIRGARHHQALVLINLDTQPYIPATTLQLEARRFEKIDSQVCALEDRVHLLENQIATLRKRFYQT